MGKVSSEGPRCCFHWGQKSGMPKSSEIPEIRRNRGPEEGSPGIDGRHLSDTNHIQGMRDVPLLGPEK
jgi:hypothetical protein